LKLIENSSSIAANSDKREFVKSLIGVTFPILDVQIYKIDPTTNTYIPSVNTSSLTDSTIDYFNVFFIPNFTKRLDNGSLVDLYPGAVESDYSLLNIQSFLGIGQSIPILNVTQQPVFSFEMVHRVPDTSEIGGTVVN
jgi:hypothetical protein